MVSPKRIEVKTKKLTVGAMLGILTIVGSILIGGSNFGELRSATRTNAKAILEHRIHLESLAIALRKENMENMRTVAKMSSDIEWIKRDLQGRL